MDLSDKYACDLNAFLKFKKKAKSKREVNFIEKVHQRELDYETQLLQEKNQEIVTK
jgi:hypothetical protein